MDLDTQEFIKKKSDDFNLCIREINILGYSNNICKNIGMDLPTSLKEINFENKKEQKYLKCAFMFMNGVSTQQQNIKLKYNPTTLDTIRDNTIKILAETTADEKKTKISTIKKTNGATTIIIPMETELYKYILNCSKYGTNRTQIKETDEKHLELEYKDYTKILKDIQDVSNDIFIGNNIKIDLYLDGIPLQEGIKSFYKKNKDILNNNIYNITFIMEVHFSIIEK